MNDLARFSMWSPAAAGLTILLFLLMTVLARTDAPVLPEPREVIEIFLAKPVEDIDPVRGPRDPVLPEAVEPPPTVRLEIDRAGPVEGPGRIETGPVRLGPVTLLGDMRPSITPQSGAVVFRAAPTYPPRELSMGIEGRCTVRYDVLGSGATTNIQALACDSAGFARAATAAVARWRHEADPALAAHSVAASGVTTEIVFTLD